MISSVHLSFSASRGQEAVSAGYPSVQSRGNVTVGPTTKRLTNQSIVWGKSIREGSAGWADPFRFPSALDHPNDGLGPLSCSPTYFRSGWHGMVVSSPRLPTNNLSPTVSLSDGKSSLSFFFVFFFDTLPTGVDILSGASFS